jgi:DNA-binding transcriptional LysR family regulator
MGQEPPPGFSADLLLRETLVAAASPEYLATVAQEGKIDWSRAILLKVQTLSLDWSAWVEATGTLVPEAAESLHFDTIHMAQEAAARGLGIAIVRRPFVEEHLRSGRLVVVGPTRTGLSSSYWLVTPEGTETRPEMIAFRRWLLEIASRDQGDAPEQLPP